MDSAVQQLILDRDLLVQSSQGHLLKRIAAAPLSAGESMAPWLREWTGLHLKRLCEPVLSGGKTLTVEADLQERLHRPCLLRIKVEPLVRRSRVAGVLVTLQDLTAEKKVHSDRQLRANVEILSTLAAPLVELLHAPLSSLMNRLSMALQSGSPAILQDDLLSIQEGIYRLNQVTTALERLIQNPELCRQRVDVYRTMEKAVDVVRMLFSRKAVEFHLAAEASSARVRGNDITLEQALIHILSNAAEAMPDGGVVTIQCRLEKSEGTLYIVIRDQGEGMSRQECEKALLPFYGTKPGDHLGLGLPTAFRIFDVHGGGMELISTPGEGTTVTIRLPVESWQA